MNKTKDLHCRNLCHPSSAPVKSACWSLTLAKKVLMRQELTKIHSTQSRFARFWPERWTPWSYTFPNFRHLITSKFVIFRLFYCHLHLSYLKGASDSHSVTQDRCIQFLKAAPDMLRSQESGWHDLWASSRCLPYVPSLSMKIAWFSKSTIAVVDTAHNHKHWYSVPWKGVNFSCKQGADSHIEVHYW